MSTPAYHAWTHRPKAMGGTDPISMPLPKVFRAMQWNTTTTTTTGVDFEPLDFDFYGNPDNAIFQPDFDVVTGLLGAVRVMAAGFVVVNFLIEWIDSFDFPVAGMIQDLELVRAPASEEHTRKTRAGVGSGVSYSISLARHYPTLDYEDGHGGNDLPTFSFLAADQSGSARELWGRFDIAYWPAEIGDLIETEPP